MIFSSITFLFFFLPVTLILYYLGRSVTWKNCILLAASIIFYAWGEPVYIILMLISILFNYYAGRDIELKQNRSSLIFSILVNIFILGYFKYSGFLIENVNRMTGAAFPVRNLALPIGISFYTFQAMSYLIDVYRGDSHAQKKILPFAVYITMFPQLIAGPIVRYEDIEKQLVKRQVSEESFTEGLFIFIKGFAKKVILANCIGALHTQILGLQLSEMSALTAWIGAIAYTLQIFNDFSGYSDMAIGLGLMLGFNFPVNFDRPYLSKSITEFWRRWHISLSTWFREYVYIPLGGNRKGLRRQIINLLIVWLLTGLWHGAAWNFVIWGLYYGVLLILEKFLLKDIINKTPVFIRWAMTFALVIIGWVFFFSTSLVDAVRYLAVMFGANVAADSRGCFYLLCYGGLLVLAFIPSVLKDGLIRKLPAVLEWIAFILLFIVSIAFLVSESYNPFLYFRF